MKNKYFIFITKFYLSSLSIFFIIAVTTASAAERMSISVPIAHVRSGPGTNYKILWKVEKYHPIKIIGNSGDWYKFADFEGDKGWIHKSLISNVSAVIVKKDDCNVRSGPGTNHKILFKSGKGVPFKVLEQQGDWLHIQHSDGDKGWIYKSLVW